MKNWNAPTADDVDRVVAKLSDMAQVRYFFERLENPLWIEPLRKEGFFRNPPEPVAEPGGGFRSAPWPPVFYLDRMANDPRFSQLIAETLRDFIASSNLSVISKTMDIVVKLDPNHVKVHVPRIKKWISMPHAQYLHKEMGEVAQRLLEAGHTSDGLALAKALLYVRRPPPSTGPQTAYSLPRPRTALEPYWYDHVLREITPSLAHRVGVPALDYIAELLGQTLRITHPDSLPPHDASHVWRPSIEHVNERPRDRVEDSLLTALRDIAAAIVRDGKASLSEVIEKLEAFNWNAHRRVALHLLRVFGDRAPHEVAKRLTDLAVFDDGALRHEYFLLAKEWYARLAEADKSRVLSLVMDGPHDLDEWASYVERRYGAPPSAAEREAYRKRWRRDRLTPIVAYLDEAHQEQYAGWIEAYGTPQFHDAVVRITGGVGPASPLSADELLSKGDEDLLGYLRDYKEEPREVPLDGWEDVGLARQLEAAVDKEPSRFLKRVDDFAQLRPRFIESILSGIERSARRGAAVDWPAAAGFLEATIKNGRVGGSDRAAVMAVCQLLTTGFRPVEVAIPFELRPRVWKVLAPFAESPNPTPEEETAQGYGDVTSYSINTARGSAMRCVVEYGLWVYRALAPGAKWVSLPHDIPEVHEILDRHLGDQSPAIRSVYGELLPWLILMDRDWVRERVDRIFPGSRAEEPLRDAAWEGYIRLPRAYDEAFALVRGEYARAVRGLDPGEPEDHRHPERQLPDHLMELYWRGKLNFGEQDRLLESFFERAPPWMRAQATQHIGYALQGTPGVVDRPVAERLEQLFEWRVHEGADMEEIRGFSRWFASTKLDPAWSGKMLVRVLALTELGFDEHVVLESLAGSSRDPAEKLALMKAVLGDDLSTVGFRLWTEPIRTVLTEVVDGEDPDARREALELVDRLIHAGLHEFRDLHRE